VEDALPRSEGDLLASARAGDREALETLVTRYEPRVYRFGMTMCRNEDDARDVLQDTFLAMVRSLQSFRADSSLSTWLYAIAHHACLKRRRRKASAPRRVVSLETLDGVDRDRLSSPAPTPETSAAAQELRTALEAAIRSLEPRQRAVLLLRDVEGMSAQAAATALGLSVPAVKSRLHRGRLAVRSALTPLLGPAPATSIGVGPCPDVASQLSRHLEGDLSARDCTALQAHLEMCPSCRAECESLRLVLASCRASPVPLVPASTQDRIREAIRACLAAATPAHAVSGQRASRGARRTRSRAGRAP
jgi:RNA polymerase sigma-70 factor (ECF subfamily)